MKVDIMGFGDPAAHHAGHGGQQGGHLTYVVNLMGGLRSAGVDVEFIQTNQDPRPDVDFLLVCSLGVERERKKDDAAAAIERAARLNCIVRDVPTGLIFHGVVDITTYRVSRELLRATPFWGVVHTTDHPATSAAIAVWLHTGARRFLIPIPYAFRDDLFLDRSHFSSGIFGNARIGKNKNTDVILSAAELLPEYSWRIRGSKSGMFWYHQLRHHSGVSAPNVEWVRDKVDAPSPELAGVFGNRIAAGEPSAFGIDITTPWWGNELEGNRAQYTTLEAVEAGLIPITLEHWNDGSWRGVFLPSPVKTGRKTTWNLPGIAQALREGLHYDVAVARQNLETMRAKYDVDVVTAQFIRMIETLTKKPRRQIPRRSSFV